MSVDKRKRWREQEQQIVARWNSAAERYRQVMEEISQQQPFSGATGPSDDLMRKAQAVREEIETLRRQVARLKAEFSTGKRY
jgi:polyhydroxyalkanoate synthesis regulator phasin